MRKTHVFTNILLASVAAGFASAGAKPDTADVGQAVLFNVDVYAIERAGGAAGFERSVTTLAGRLGLKRDPDVAADTGVATLVSVGVNGSGNVVDAAALSTVGRVTLLSSGAMASRDGEAAVMSVFRERPYTKSVSPLTKTVGVVTDGFWVSFTPSILNDGKIEVKFSLALSDFDGVDVSSGSSKSGQSPQAAIRQIAQTRSVMSGQTFVIADGRQAGSEDSSGDTGRTIVVVATPYIGSAPQARPLASDWWLPHRK